VQVVREIRFREGETVKTIPVHTTLEVISIQPQGVEVEHAGRRMVVRQEFLDLRPRVMAIIRKIAIDAEKKARQQQAPAGEQSGGVKKVDLRELRDMGTEERDAFLQTLTTDQRRQLLERLQSGELDRLNEEDAAGAEAAARPQPRIQSTALTDFIRQLDRDLLIENNEELRDYREISFRDNQFFLLLFGTEFDKNTPKLIPLLKEFYQRAQVYRKNFEVVYVDRSPRPEYGFSFIREMDMPWPSVNPEGWQEREELLGLMPRTSPALVLVDRQGEVISSTMAADGSARGAQEVLMDLSSVIELPSGPAPGM
jgi:hypothetical protein